MMNLDDQKWNNEKKKKRNEQWNQMQIKITCEGYGANFYNVYWFNHQRTAEVKNQINAN